MPTYTDYGSDIILPITIPLFDEILFALITIQFLLVLYCIKEEIKVKIIKKQKKGVIKYETNH